MTQELLRAEELKAAVAGAGEPAVLHAAVTVEGSDQRIEFGHSSTMGPENAGHIWSSRG